MFLNQGGVQYQSLRIYLQTSYVQNSVTEVSQENDHVQAALPQSPLYFLFCPLKYRTEIL